MNIITRKLEFDSGHRVLGHESKCAHLHGHRYVAEVTVQAMDLDSIGRVIDFSVIKQFIGGWIDQNWDHNILLHPEDPLADLTTLLNGLPLRRVGEIDNAIFGRKSPYIMPAGDNPTAENMAYVLFGVSREMMRSHGLEVKNVRLYETPNCWADCDGL